MASQVTVTTASAGTSSPQLVPQKTIFDMLQDVQKRIQLYGPGPYTSEQVKELEKLKTIYVRLKSEHEKAIQETKTAAGPRPTAVMAPVTQVLAPVQVASPGMVQISKLAPATTNLPTQLTTVLPATTMASVMPAVTAKTILPQPSLTQVQTHNVVMNPANMQQLQRSTEVAQMKVTSAQAAQLHVTQTPVQAVTPGQQLTISGKPFVAQQLPASGIKTVTVTTTPLQVTQGTPQTVTLQRTLVPSKSPVNLPITLAPSGTVSAHVPAGSHSVTNIAPAPVPVTLSKGLHSATQMTGKAPTGTSMRSDTSSPQPNQVLTKRRLQELLHEIDPREQMDDDVEDLLLQIADDFIESVVSASCQIAKHRKSNTLEVRDVQLHLERCWNMWVPGFGSDELRPFKKQATTEAHKQRLALIRKSMKK